jgi:hypothetical protein
VALCAAALRTDGGGCEASSLVATGERLGGMRCPEDRGEPCIGGVSEGLHGDLLWPLDLGDSIGALSGPLSGALVLWVGQAIHRHRSPLEGFSGR